LAGALNPDIVLLDLHMADESRYLPEIVEGTAARKLQMYSGYIGVE
jgi:hypothetical protein